MKGIVFNLLYDVICREYGEDFLDGILEKSGATGIYTLLGDYDEQELLALADAASATLGIPCSEFFRWFGRAALPLLAGRYPIFFGVHSSARTFIPTLGDVLHWKTKKILPPSEEPDFDSEDSATGALRLTCRSSRMLCDLTIGLMEGAAGYYGEDVVTDHERCMQRGDDRCVFDLRFERQAA